MPAAALSNDTVAALRDATRNMRVSAGTVQPLAFTVTAGANAITLEQVVVTGHAIVEATHGTAPKYADQDKVNPGSLTLSGEMMLRYMGWTEAGQCPP